MTSVFVERARRAAILAALLIAGCKDRAAPQVGASAEAVSIDDALAKVAAIHGAPGPWAVAGYRMGRFALQKLGLTPQSFDLEVVHRSPHAVKYSCIADGASAATGASLGKLNLSVVDSDRTALATTYRKKSTGQGVTLRPTAAFQARFDDFPIAEAPVLGKTVMGLSDSDVFEEVAP